MTHRPFTARRRTAVVALAVAPLAALAPATAGAVGAAPGAAEPGWTLRILPPTGDGTTSSALGLADSGVVVGTARTTAGSRPQNAIRWTGDSTTDLGALPGATFSRAFDVASDGTAVGEGFTPSPEVSKALLWRPDGTLVELPSLNPSGTGVAQDVSDRGRVVGVSSNGTAVRGWIGGESRIRELPLPDAEGTVTTTRANGISEEGTVAGTAFVVHAHDDHTHTVGQAVTWRDFDADLLEPLVEDTPSAALGVSPDGSTVAGEASNGLADSAQAYRAVVWAGDEPTALPSLAGLRHARANAVTDDGTVVGHATTFYGNSSSDGRALMWDEGQVVDLNTVATLPEGVVLRNAADINADGVIAGSASTPSGTRGFTLTPDTPVDPEPTPTTVEVDDVPAVRYGAPLDLRVTVSDEESSDDPDATDPTGAVTVSDGRRTLAQGDLTGGVAELQVPGGDQRPGTHTLTAAYAGDETHAADEATVEVVVRRAATSTDLTLEGSDRRPTATVVVSSPTVDEPRGTVVLRVDGRVVRTLTLRDGAASARLPRLSSGAHTVAARFSGGELTTASGDREDHRVD